MQGGWLLAVSSLRAVDAEQILFRPEALLRHLAPIRPGMRSSPTRFSQPSRAGGAAPWQKPTKNGSFASAEGALMAESLLESKLKEAVERTRGDVQAAVRLLAAWSEKDEKLLRALVQPFLQGILFHLVDRTVKQVSTDPVAPRAAQASPKAAAAAAKPAAAEGTKPSQSQATAAK